MNVEDLLNYKGSKDASYLPMRSVTRPRRYRRRPYTTPKGPQDQIFIPEEVNPSGKSSVIQCGHRKFSTNYRLCSTNPCRTGGHDTVQEDIDIDGGLGE